MAHYELPFELMQAKDTDMMRNRLSVRRYGKIYKFLTKDQKGKIDKTTRQVFK